MIKYLNTWSLFCCCGCLFAIGVSEVCETTEILKFIFRWAGQFIKGMQTYSEHVSIALFSINNIYLLKYTKNQRYPPGREKQKHLTNLKILLNSLLFILTFINSILLFEDHVLMFLLWSQWTCLLVSFHICKCIVIIKFSPLIHTHTHTHEVWTCVHIYTCVGVSPISKFS